MYRFALALLLLALLPFGSADAACFKQSDGTTLCPTLPSVLSSTQARDTIAAANQWQTAVNLGDDAARAGCLIVNNSGDTLQVFFGSGLPAAGVNTVSLPPEGWLSCNVGAGVLGDLVQITGPTTGDAYLVIVQHPRL